MFEAQAAYYLNKYLGKYVDGVDPKSLRISVWKGNVVLENLRVRPEALEELNLPVTVKAGVLGTLSLKVPWNKLGKEPVVIEIDKLYVLAGPFEEHRDFKSDEELDAWVESANEQKNAAKRSRVKDMELEWIQKHGKRDGRPGDATEEDNSGGYLQYYIETILGNFELKITNVHIRYEDELTTPGHTFAVGLTFGELSAHTVDKDGKRAFVNAKEMEAIRKYVNLGRLAVYFDANSELWSTGKNWSEISLDDWDSYFLHCIHEGLEEELNVYLLKPVDGALTYLRRRRIGGRKLLENEARQEVDIELQDIDVFVSRKQYEHVQNLLTIFNLYQLSLPHRHLRPPCRPLNSASRRMWWLYALKGVRLSIVGCSSSIKHFAELCDIRRMYVPLYVKCLEAGNVGGDETIASMDRELEEPTILVFRHLAHVKVEHSARKKAMEEAAMRKPTWTEWFWGTTPEHEAPSESDETMEKAEISEEDWNQINTLMGVRDDDDCAETPWTLKNQFSAQVGKCSVTLVDKDDKWIICGACTNTVAINRIYPETNSIEFSMVTCSLSCPAGTIISSGMTSIGTERDSMEEPPSSSPVLLASYIQKPQDSQVSAIVKVKCECAFITYYAVALQSFTSFFEPVAKADFSVLEAQAAAGLRRARKRAEEQLLEMLNEEQTTVEIDVEVEAPKLAIPKQDRGSHGNEPCTVVLNLGHLKLGTDLAGKRKLPPGESGNYECLKVTISDVAVILVDGSFTWPETLSSASWESSIKLEKHIAQQATIIPILERCGMQSDIQIARRNKPGLTPVRLNFKVPQIHSHFSPSRYSRIMNVLDSLTDSSQASHPVLAVPNDGEEVTYSGPIKLLMWEGFGWLNHKWQSHYIMLKRDRLCIYKSKKSIEATKWIRMDETVEMMPLGGAQALGKLNVVALVSTGIDPTSVLEDARSVVLCLGNPEEKTKFMHAVELARRKLALLTTGTSFEAVAQSINNNQTSESVAQTNIMMEARGKVDELLIFVAGRTPNPEYCPEGSDAAKRAKVADMVHGEYPLVVLSQTMGRLDVTLAQTDLRVDLSVNQFAVEDLLVGTPENRRFLAQSDELGDGNGGDDDYARLMYKQKYQHVVDDESPSMELALDFSSLRCSCHRPTIAALIAFIFDVQDALDGEEETEEVGMKPVALSELSSSLSDASMRSSIHQWEGQNRVLFNFSIAMKKLELAANYEDGPGLNVAIAVAENFHYNLNTYQDTIEFTSSLGNVLVFDGTILEGSSYRQICGLKSETEGSLINIKFQSHTIGESFTNDRVPNGVEFYSFQANLSAVEIVFFYRWLQEFLFYIYVLLEMIPGNLQEELPSASDMLANAGLGGAGLGTYADPGATLVLLDVELDAPLVNLPRNSNDQNYIMIDLGQVKVSNTLTWLRSSDHNVLMDQILVKCTDLSCKVYKDSVLGPNMIEDLGDEGVSISCFRKLEDPSKSIPIYQVLVAIPKMHCSVSDAEYDFMVNTVLGNIQELTCIPPKAYKLTSMEFPESASMQSTELPSHMIPASESLKRLSSNMSRKSSITLRRDSANQDKLEELVDPSLVTLKISVDIKSWQLTLTNAHKSGGDAILLGRMQMANSQVVYQSFSGGNMNVAVSVPTLEAIDLRPNEANYHPVILSSCQNLYPDGGGSGDGVGPSGKLTPSLIVLDYSCTDDQQSLYVRLQRPTIRVELGMHHGFILAILDFVVPSYSMGVKIDKGFSTRDILLDTEPYVFTSDLYLSPEVRLLADRPGVAQFVLDGDGHHLILPSGISPHEMLPLILIGTGATLTLRNVKIINSESLGSIIQLKPGGQILLDNDVKMIQGDNRHLPPPSHPSLVTRPSVFSRSMQTRSGSSIPRFLFNAHISAPGVSLHVVDNCGTTQQDSTSSTLPFVKCLTFALDLTASCEIVDEDYSAKAELKHMLIENTACFRHEEKSDLPSSSPSPVSGTEVSVRILEPCDVKLEYKASKNTTELDFSLSQVVLNVTPDLLDTTSKIQTHFVDHFMVPGPYQPLARVSSFNLIWSSQVHLHSKTLIQVLEGQPGSAKNQGYMSFWRPRPPPGYGILGDTVTCGQTQCNEQVCTVALSSGLAASPVGFEKVWEEESGIALWNPIAPIGYTSMGCLATTDGNPPPSTACVCLHENTLVETSLAECVWRRAPGSIWRVENAARTFLVCSDPKERPSGQQFDLRSPIGISPHALVSPTNTTSRHYQYKFLEARKNLIKDISTRRLVVSTVEFKKIWVDKKAASGIGSGIWRPIPPPGYAITGDCLEIAGSGPPQSAAVIFDSGCDDFNGGKLLTRPRSYLRVWQDGSGKKEKRLTFYRPVPKTGYVAMGYVAVIGPQEPDINLVRCVNESAVSQLKEASETPDTKLKRNKHNINGWVSDKKSKNFVMSFVGPPKGEMFRLNLSDDDLKRLGSEGLKDKRTDFKLNSGPVSIQVQDITRMPIVEIEVHAPIVTARTFGDVTKSCLSFDVALSSYNSMLKAWEPILETTHMVVHLDQNTSPQDVEGVAPGSQLRISSTGDSMRVTLACAALVNIMKHYKEIFVREDEGLVRPCMRSDANSMDITMLNLLGCHAFSLSDFGDFQKAVELEPDTQREMQQPIPSPPTRHDNSLWSIPGKQALVIGLLKLHIDMSSTQNLQMSAVQCLLCEDISPCLRTCVYHVNRDGHIDINEQFVLDAPKGGMLQHLTVSIVETTLSAVGEPIASGKLFLGNLMRQESNLKGVNVDLVDRHGNGIGELLMDASLESLKGSIVQQSLRKTKQGSQAIRLFPTDNWIEIPHTGVQKPQKTRPMSFVNFDTAPLAVAIKVGGGVVMESGYCGPRQHAILRSMCKFVNSTNLPLEMRLVDADEGDGLKTSTSSVRLSEALIEEAEVFENERRLPGGSFSHKNLLPTDRKRYSLVSTGARNSDDFPDIQLPSGYEWLGPWEVETCGYVDPDGWCYAADFKFMKYPPKKGSQKRGMLDMTRRRRWVRKKRMKSTQSAEASGYKGNSIVLGTVSPGYSHPLPLKWQQGSWQLQVRPVLGEKVLHHWCLPVLEEEGYGLDLGSLKQGSRRLASCSMKSGVASEADVPMHMLCSSVFWLTFIVEGDMMPMPVGMDPMLDWTITAHPPLVLHNVLPFSGHFMVWEQPERGSPMQIREQGKIDAGQKAAVHGADMRCEVSLSFYLEDGEFAESEPVTVSRGYSEQAAGISGKQTLPESFRVSRNGSVAAVMLERELDVGASHCGKQLDPGAAVALGYPLAVRMYVPLWVVNLTQVSINIGLVSLNSGDEGTEQDDIDSSTHVKCVSTTLHGNLSSFRAFTTSTAKPHGTEIFSYPAQGTTGAKLQVLGSGWSPPIPLRGGKVSNEPESKEGSSADEGVRKELQPGVDASHRVLVWAEVPEVNQLCPIVAHLDLSVSGFLRTRVLVLEPHIVVSNQTGLDIELQQPSSEVPVAAHHSGPPLCIEAGTTCVPLIWSLGPYPQCICAQARSSGSTWSTPFIILYPNVGDVFVILDNFPLPVLQHLAAPVSVRMSDREVGRCLACLKISVSMLSPGCLHVIFHSLGGVPPFNVENRTQHPLRFRQKDGVQQWNVLPPLSAQGWVLPNLVSAGQFVEFQDALKPDMSMSTFLPLRNGSGMPQCGYSLDNTKGWDDQISLGGGSVQGILEVVDMEDRLHAYSTTSQLATVSFGSALESWGYGKVIRIHQELPSRPQFSSMVTDEEGPTPFKLVVNIGLLSVSLVDEVPEELLVLTVDDLSVEFLTGIGAKGRFNLVDIRARNVQLDNQLLDSVYPVLLAQWNRNGKGLAMDKPPLLSISVVREAGIRQGHHKYPAISSRVGDLQMSIHENVIWRIKNMLDLLISRTSGDSQEGVSADIGLDIDFLQLAGIKTKISVSTDPTRRPRFSQSWSLGLEFANIEDVEVKVKGFEAERLSILRSVLLKQLEAHLKNQITSIALSLLDFYFSVGGVSQFLSGMGKVIRTAVDDPKEISQKNQGKVDSLHDGFLEGTSAFGRGLFKGITGVIQKPIEGAIGDGVEGFFKGAAKGIVGVALTPLGGIFEAASKVTEGIDAITSRSQAALERRRLPLCIRGDRVLRPYSNTEAQGNYLMQMALASAGMPGKDSYEGHRILDAEVMLMWTSQRLILAKGAGLSRWHDHLRHASISAVIPVVKAVWGIYWDNLLAVNCEASRDSRVVVIYAKRRVPMFLNNFRQILKTGAEGPTNRIIRDELWSLMEQHSQTNPSQHEVHPTELLSTASLPLQAQCIDFELVWKPPGAFGVSIWHLKCPPGYASVGHVVGLPNPPNSVPVFLDDSASPDLTTLPQVAKPLQYALIFRDSNPQGGKITVWVPVAPPGYVAIGALVVPDIARPSLDSVRCLREDLCVKTNLQSDSIWRGGSSDIGDTQCSFWRKEGDHMDSFWAIQTLQRSSKEVFIPLRAFPDPKGYL